MRNELARKMEFGSLLARIGVIFSLFFIMMIALSGGVSLVNNIGCDHRTKSLIIAALQCVLVFVIPALIYARIYSTTPFREVGLSNAPKWRQFMGIVILYIVALPALNQIIYWNESITFPPSLSDLESSLRQLEEQAQQSAETLLSTTSIGGLISGVLVIGVLTGFSEELFFRGALQRGISASGVNPHISIWCTAFFFSAMHFQFFGFFPRLFLGAFFGYLFYWTGSIWVSAMAHALNNSLVVITVWMIKNNFISTEIDKLGVSETGFPFMASISILLFFAIIAKGRKYFFQSSNNNVKSPQTIYFK